MKNSIKRFLFEYGTSLMNNGTIHHDLGTIVDTGAEERILSGTHETPINVNQHVKCTLIIIK